MAGEMIPVVQETSAVTCGAQISCANVWEATFAHAYKGKEDGGQWYDAGDNGNLYDTGKCNRIQHLVFAGSGILFCGNYLQRIWNENRVHILCGRGTSWIYTGAE